MSSNVSYTELHRCFGTRSGPAARVPDRYRRESFGLERPWPSPVCFFLVRSHYPGKFRWMGRLSSQRPFRLARDARPRVCTPACNTICACQHATAVYPPSMVARYLYRCIHASQTVNWVIQGPSAVSAWLVHRLYYRSASQSPSPVSFVPLVTCPWRHVLPKPRYAKLLAAAPTCSSVNPHVEPW